MHGQTRSQSSSHRELRRQRRAVNDNLYAMVTPGRALAVLASSIYGFEVVLHFLTEILREEDPRYLNINYVFEPHILIYRNWLYG